MKRTQIQIPDGLYEEAREAADLKEISLAELVRRGLEYMVSVTPGARVTAKPWRPPPAHALGSTDPFTARGWRETLHTERLRVAEEGGEYPAGDEA